MHLCPREQHQPGGAQDLQAVTHQEDLAAIEAVGHVPCGQQKEQARKKERQPGEAQIQRTMSDGVNLPRNGYRLRFGAQDGGDACQLVAPEVAGGKGLHAAPRRPGRIGWPGGKEEPCPALGYIDG